MNLLSPKTLLSILFLTLFSPSLLASERMNVVLITVDDMNADSLGSFGCKVKDTSPNIDKFAMDSMRFNYAHVHATSCIPSRNAISSGRYLYNSGIEGFYALPKEEVTFRTLPEVLRANGYFTMIRGKAHHSYPYHPYPAFDIMFDTELKEQKVNIRKCETFYTTTKKGIEAAAKAGKPFFFSMDIHDPHVGYYNWLTKKGKVGPGMNKDDKDNAPSKIFTADEITLPGFLPNTELTKQEMAAYYSTVRRADDSFGYMIKALKETGVYDNTMIVFLSDHGMPEPFAKTANYYHSSHTPLTVRVPKMTKAGSVDNDHMIGASDIFPSILEVLDIKEESGLDGRSFASILKGKKQENRDFVLTMYEENVGGNRQPTRSIITKDYAYIWNPWSDGERKFATATKGMAATAEMFRLAQEGDQYWASRYDIFNYRVPEELYNYEKDPDALTNLIDQPEMKAQLDSLRATLSQVMTSSKDPLEELFADKDNKTAIAAHLAKVDKESAWRKTQDSYARSGKAKASKKKQSSKNKKPSKTK